MELIAGQGGHLDVNRVVANYFVPPLCLHHDLAGAVFCLPGFIDFDAGGRRHHVLVGLLAISVTIAVMSFTRGPRAGARALESVSLYWHFVDAVWVVIFPVVYLWTLLP